MEPPASSVASKPLPSLRDRRRADTKAALQSAAFRLFHTQGFRETTVDAIAAEAGVSRSTFFRYFGSKEALVTSRSDEMGERFVDLLRERPAAESPLQALEEALLSLARFAAQTDTLSELRARATVLQRDPSLARREAEARARWVDVISNELARRAGRDEVDIEDSLAAALLIEISHHITAAFIDHDEPPEGQIRAHFAAARRLVR